MGIQITNLNKAYGEHQVLENFCAEIPGRENHPVLWQPQEKGKPRFLESLWDWKSRMAERLQDWKTKESALFFRRTGCAKISVQKPIFAWYRREGKAEAGTFCSSCKDGFSAVGLEGWGKRPVKELSGGMKRRAALLRALYADWNILFLDEPFKGLDRETKDKVLAFVREKCRGKTVLCVTHEKEEAEILGAEILEL